MKNEYLIKHLAKVDLSFTKVINNEVVEVKRITEIAAFDKITNLVCKENWSSDINELETFFKGIATNNQPIQLNNWTLINDVPQFVNNHLATVKANDGKRTFLPYFNRLQELKQILTNI